MRVDHEIIMGFIQPGTKVLDLGCGNGDLLSELIQEKQVDASGIEIRPEGVRQCISKGLSVIQGDLEEIVQNYGDKTFDYCILSLTLQDLHNPDFIISEMTESPTILSSHSIIWGILSIVFRSCFKDACLNLRIFPING